DLPVGLARTPLVQNLVCHALGCGMRAMMGAGGAVIETLDTLLSKSLEPLVRRADTHARRFGRFFDPKALGQDAIDKKCSTAGAETGMFMQVHPGLLGCCLGRTYRIPGSPRMNNLLKDHS